MRVSEALEEYRYSLLRLSPQTQDWYNKNLTRFAAWCDEQDIPLEKVKPIVTRKYIDYLRTTPSKATGQLLSSYSIHGHARAIRAFLRFCNKEEELGELVTTKAARVDMPKLVKKVLPVYSSEEIQAMLKACKEEEYTELQLRSYAVIAVLYETGIRAGELCGLTLDNVFLTPGDSYIKVFGKGRKEREVGLGKTASLALKKYLRHRHAPEKELHVFLGKKHLPLTVHGLGELVRRIADYAGVEDSHCHKFRHTFAVNYLAANGNLFDLARLMGHSTTEVTRLYLETWTSTQARQRGISVLDSLK